MSGDQSNKVERRGPGAERPTGEDPSQEFPIVGIGASAGGLAAFERFFSNLPPDMGMAYVVVQHLSPPHKSILPEILQRYTSMRVFEVTSGIAVKQNCVYVIPPSNDLALMDGHLILIKPSEERGYRFPIDIFFHSLAEARGSLAIGIVLSGTASDGSLGVKSIKAGGGLTLAQDPDTAEFGDMPRNAIETKQVDFILPPEKMGELILRYSSHQGLDIYEVGDTQTFTPVVTMQKLYHILRTKTGHDFSLYKQSTLLRRIERRIKITQVANLEGYIDYVQQNPEEIDALFQEMLINVTHFFRDPKAFHTLIEKAIQPLIPLKQAAQAPIRVWVAGCSSGEEAYSITIAIQEQIEGMSGTCKVQLFATDLDADAVESARRGLYTDVSLENVSAERLQRFFNKEADGYQIKKSIRDMVVFSTHNLIFDPPFSKIDLLCCRNVLIYLEQELQKQVLPMFHYALNPGGILFLGNSESIGGLTDLFGVIDRKYRIYYRKEIDAHHPIQTRLKRPASQAAPAVPERRIHPVSQGRLRELVEKELLRFHSPSCVLIDKKNIILYIHGRTGKYLEPYAGQTSANLLKMAREGLKAELATATHTVAANQGTVTRKGIRVKTNGDYQFIDLTVRLLEGEGDASGMILVVFEEVLAPAPELSLRGENLHPETERVADLERVLKEKDEYLTTVINELEDANQDLKSYNEELMSTNEEMQSNNEELETSKEELQSVNEELSTVNTELNNKNAELTAVNNDIYNLMASTDIGTIFLDLDMRIRRYTPAVQRIYNFLPGDIGRPLHHFHANLKYGTLIDDIHQVLYNLIPKAIEAQSLEGTWYLVNIKPYRTLENVIDGVVITFVDITQQKQGEELRRLATVIRDSNDAITLQDFQGNILAWNRGAEQMYGWTEAEALQMSELEMIPEHLRDPMKDVYRRLSKGEDIRSYETKRLTRGGRLLDVWVTLSILVDDLNRPVAIGTTERDITEWKQADRQLRYENRALKALSSWFARFGDTKTIPPARMMEVCQMLVESGGYLLAWVGQLQKDRSKHLELTGWAGAREADGLPPNAVQTLAKRSQKQAETALASRRPVVLRNINAESINTTGEANALKPGYASLLLLPLVWENEPLGVLIIHAAEPEAFADQEIAYLLRLAEGISQKLRPS